MKIALFTDTYIPEINGVATSTKTLKDVFERNGHEVLVVCTNTKNNALIYENNEVRVPGLEVKAIYGYRLVSPINSKTFKIIKNYKPDVIHVQTDFGVAYIGRFAAKKLHIPIVYTYHTMYEDYTYYVTKGRFERIAVQGLRWYARKVINYSTEFIAPSNKTKDYMRTIGVESYINVIPTGIDFSRFSLEAVGEENILNKKKELGIENKDLIFISLGRIAKEKSIDIVIKSYYEFKIKHPEINSCLLIVGLGPAVPELMELALSLGIDKEVLFLGKVAPEETPLYYRLGDIFVSASISETQGLTFMEAMASELITLARFDNNLLDVIKDEKTGYFFNDPNHFVTIIEKIMKLSDEERKKIVKNALNQIDNYSDKRFYERIKKVYETAIRKNY